MTTLEKHVLLFPFHTQLATECDEDYSTNACNMISIPYSIAHWNEDDFSSKACTIITIPQSIGHLNDDD